MIQAKKIANNCNANCFAMYLHNDNLYLKSNMSTKMRQFEYSFCFFYTHFVLFYSFDFLLNMPLEAKTKNVVYNANKAKKIPKEI